MTMMRPPAYGMSGMNGSRGLMASSPGAVRPYRADPLAHPRSAFQGFITARAPESETGGVLGSGSMLPQTHQHTVRQKGTAPAPTLKVSFSDARDMMAGDQVQNVEVTLPTSSSPTTLATVTLDTGNGPNYTTAVPVRSAQLSRLLDGFEGDVYYRPHQRTLRERLSQFGNQTLQEILVPLAVFGAMFGGVLLAMDRIKKRLEANDTRSLIEESITHRRSARPLKDILPLYPQTIGDAVAQVQSGRLPVLILYGPHGTGKSYLLDGLGDALGEKKATLTLNVEVSPQIRSLLTHIYTGNQHESVAALKALENIHGGPIERLILRADNVHEYTATMGQLIRAGIGNTKGMNQVREPGRFWWNGSGKTRSLPELVILASSNQPVTFHNGEEEGRVGPEGFQFLEQLSPESQAQIVTHTLKQVFPNLGWTEEGQGEKDRVVAILQSNPGYSTRRIQTVIEGLAQDSPAPTTPGALLDRFEQALSRTLLDSMEMAGIVRRWLVDHVEGRVREADTGNTLTAEEREQWASRLNRILWKKSEETFQGRGPQYRLSSQDLWDRLETMWPELAATHWKTLSSEHTLEDDALSTRALETALATLRKDLDKVLL